MKKFLYLFLVFNLFIISACDNSSGGSSSGSSGGGVIPNSITIQGSNTVKLGETSQYSAILNPANFTSEKIVWSVDNESVGTIDSTGLFTSISKGSVNIKAAAGGVESALFNVKVTVPVESITVSDLSPKQVNVGEPAQFKYEINPNNADYTSITWNVDNTTIANINKDTGELTGNTSGTVYVTVTVDEITSTPYPVKVILPLESISINGPDSVNALAQATYTVTSTPEGATITNVEWSVNDTNVATIDASTGVLTAKNTAGQVTITANADGKTTTKLVNIIKNIEIKGGNKTAVGGIITLKAIYNTTNNLTWNSSNPAVATVENGVVTGKSAGSTNITVTENGKTSAPFTITIVDMPNGYEIVDGAYHVYSVAGFKAWREAVNTNSSTSLYLYSDLDFSSEQDNPMIAGVFKGTFNGNDHIIKNYTMTNSQGFFYNIGSDGKMLNVTFDNANATYTYDYHNSSAGLITCVNNGFIENVHIKNSQLTVNTNNQRGNDIGMFAARANVSTMEIVPEIKNCSITDSTLTVNKRMDYTGGIVGQALGNIVVTGCFVDNLTITTQGSTYNIAGIGSIVGQLPGSPKNSTIIGCGVTNTTIKNTAYYASVVGGNIGGFVGLGNGNVHASYFYGTVDNKDNTAANLDFYRFSGISSDLYVKQQGGTIGSVNGQNTTKVDDTNVTWEQAVENMNKYLTDNGYTDFSFRYDKSKGYPVIDYAK